jgi:membrane associated rhomboid family serine protease
MMMKGRKKSILPYIPGYDNNAVLKLIFFLAGSYIALAISWAIVMIVYIKGDNFNIYFVPNIALPRLADFSAHWYTLFIYGIFHFPNSFMEMLSNMLWLYCFGSVLQMLVGKKQIAPIFFFSMFVGGVFYLLAQLLPGGLGACPPHIMGPRAGLMGICAAAVTISPKYRFYLSDTFSIPILAVAGVFLVLMLIGSGYYFPVVGMMAGGAVAGFLFIKLLQAGYPPAEWLYTIGNKLERMVTPNEQAIAKRNMVRRGAVLNSKTVITTSVSEKKVDDILDKILQKGYVSLTAAEKEILFRAGKD